MNLKDFFVNNNKAAIAYSGGVDSTFLLYAAIEAGADVTAYYVKSKFQPQFEFDDALEMAEEFGAVVKVIDVDILSNSDVAANPTDRCYYCKNAIFGTIIEAASKDGYRLVLDGTNASDSSSDRPGMKALKELEVRSPLRECGLTKVEIRRLSREAGLKTWDKPAYACLATRIAAGEKITSEKLSRVEAAEDTLAGLGFSDFRVRTTGDTARLEVRAMQVPLVLERRAEILEALEKDFAKVVLNLEFRDEMEV